MVQLFLLGPLRALSADGEPMESLARSSKRLALLAYLAVEGPGEFHRRDKLLALFWPELPDRKARASLRSTLRYLRQDLGEGVLINRGRQEVGLDPSRVRVDVKDFRRSLEGGRAREAAKLYRGALLAGFHLDDAPGFQEWLELRRRELREGALVAIAGTVEMAEERGELLEAVRWARRGVSLAPLDEVTARRLIELLVRHGNRAAAGEAFEELRDRLADQLNLDPSTETVRALQIPMTDQWEDDRHLSGSMGAPGAEVTPGPPGGPSTFGVGGTEGRRSRRWIPGSVAVATIALLGAVSMMLSGEPGRDAPTSAGAPAAGELVAVLPFEVQGARELDYLTEGMMDVLSFKLSLPGRIRTVPSATVLAALDGRSQGSILERGRHVAQVVGADGFVSGRVSQVGEVLQLTATLHGINGSAAIQAGASTPDEAGLLRALDELTRKLIAGRMDGPEEQVARSAALTGTHSLTALRAFLNGERAFRQARFAEARSSYLEALEFDSTFALASVRLTAAAKWTGEFDLMVRGIRGALRFEDRLGERDRLLARADEAHWIRDDLGEALERLRMLVSRYPDDLEGRYALGDFIFHRGPRLGFPMGEGEPHFRAVVELDPGHGDALLHLLRLRVGSGSHDEIGSLVEAIMAASDVPSRTVEARAHLAARVEDEGLWREIEPGLAELEDAPLGSLVSRVIESNPNSRLALRGTDLMLTPERSFESRAQGLLFRVATELARGRPAGARARLDELVRIDETMGWHARVMVALNPLWPASPDSLEELIEVAPTARRPGVESGISTVAGTGLLEAFHLGLLSARLGDREGAERWRGRLEELLPGSRQHLDVVELRLWLNEGAGAGPPPAVSEPWSEMTPLSRWLSWSQYLRGEALRVAGRPEQALRWYRAARQDGYLWWHLAPAVHLRSAEVLEELDRPREAAREYRAVLALLAEAEPELQPLRDQVRERLAWLP